MPNTARHATMEDVRDRSVPAGPLRRLTASCACLSAAAVLIRINGDSLLLSEFGTSLLPAMYVAGATLSAGAAFFLAAHPSLVSRSARTAIVLAISLGVVLTLMAAFGHGIPRVAPVLAYLAADVLVFVLVPLFWTAALRCLGPGVARMHLGRIGASATVASLLAGVLASASSEVWQAPAIVATGVMLLLAFSLLMPTDRSDDGPFGPPPSSARRRMLESRRLMQQPQFIWIIGLFGASALLQLAVDFNFKAGLSNLDHPEAMASILGKLYAVTGTLTLLMQLFMLRPLLERGGVAATLAFSPVSIVLASVASFFTSTQSAQFAMKAAEASTNLAVFRPGSQLLFRGISRQSRARAQILAESVVRPLIVGGGGAVLALALGYGVERVSVWVVGSLAVLMLICVFGCYRSYLAGLVASIDAGKLEEEDSTVVLTEPAIQRVVEERLCDGSNRSVLALLGVLPPQRFRLEGWTLSALLARDDPDVRKSAIDWIARSRDETGIRAVLPFLDDPDAQLRLSATRALGGSSSVAGWGPVMLLKLEDPIPEVRVFAAVALCRSGVQAHRQSGKLALDQLLAKGDERVLIALATAAEDLPTGLAVDVCLGLLSKPQTTVRLAALHVSLAHPSERYIPALLDLVKEGRRLPLLIRCIDALGADGGHAVARAIGRAVAEKSIEEALRLVRLAGSLRGSDVLQTLYDTAISAHDELDIAAARSFADALELSDPGARWVDAANLLLDRGYASARDIHSIISRLCPETDGFMAWLLRDELARRLDTILKLAVWLAHQKTRSDLLSTSVMALRSALPGQSRAMASRLDMRVIGVELAGTDRERREQALELICNALPIQFYAKLQGIFEAPAPSLREIAESVVACSRDPWTLAAGLHRLAEGKEELTSTVRSMLQHSSFVVRESAASVLGRVGSGGIELPSSTRGVNL